MNDGKTPSKAIPPGHGQGHFGAEPAVFTWGQMMPIWWPEQQQCCICGTLVWPRTGLICIDCDAVS